MTNSCEADLGRVSMDSVCDPLVYELDVLVNLCAFVKSYIHR